MKNIKIITVPFDEDAVIFDNEALQMYLSGKEVLRAEPHFFQNQRGAYWSIYLETRDLRGVPYVSKTISPKRKTAENVVFDKLVGELDEVEKVRYQSLLTRRTDIAKNEGVPPYIILTNRQCLDIARSVPRTLSALAETKGVGQKRIKKHGELILEVLHGKTPATGAGSAPVRGVDGDNQVDNGEDSEVSQEVETQSDNPDRKPDPGSA